MVNTSEYIFTVTIPITGQIYRLIDFDCQGRCLGEDCSSLENERHDTGGRVVWDRHDVCLY
jgi:hypothetical protein